VNLVFITYFLVFSEGTGNSGFHVNSGCGSPNPQFPHMVLMLPVAVFFGAVTPMVGKGLLCVHAWVSV
jgi:hypothetical protein